MKTYNELYLENRKQLSEIDCDNPQLEAKLLLGYASNNSVSDLISKFSLYVTPDIENANSRYLQRRLNNEPIAYIMSSAEFYGLTFFVNRNVLIPRIETETAIDAAKELFDIHDTLRIFDLCCGSGAIGCTLANEFPHSHVVCGDIDNGAINVCRKNISLLGLSSRVLCIESDALSPPAVGLGKYDLLISNPPYIERNVIPKLDVSVKDYEPIIALDGGDDGLDFYRCIISSWSSIIKNSGYIIFEVGEEQAAPIIDMLTKNGFTGCTSKKDSFGVDRIVIAKKSERNLI